MEYKQVILVRNDLKLPKGKGRPPKSKPKSNGFVVSAEVDAAVIARINDITQQRGSRPTADEVSEDFFGEVTIEEVEKIAEKNVDQLV